MKLIEQLISFGAASSTKTQAWAIGGAVVLGYRVPELLGLPFALEQWQVLSFAGLTAVLILARMGHDIALTLRGSPSDPL